MFIVLVSICIIPTSIINRTNFYNKNKVLISDFTVHLRYLELKGGIIEQEISDLIQHINNVVANENSLHNSNDLVIYDINFPIMTDTQLDLLVEKNTFELEKWELEELIKLNQNDPTLKTRIDKINIEIGLVSEKLLKCHKEDINDTEDVFVTFRDHKIKKLFKNAYTKNTCCRKCSSSYDYLRYILLSLYNLYITFN